MKSMSFLMVVMVGLQTIAVPSVAGAQEFELRAPEIEIGACPKENPVAPILTGDVSEMDGLVFPECRAGQVIHAERLLPLYYEAMVRERAEKDEARRMAKEIAERAENMRPTWLQENGLWIGIVVGFFGAAAVAGGAVYAVTR